MKKLLKRLAIGATVVGGLAIMAPMLVCACVSLFAATQEHMTTEVSELIRREQLWRARHGTYTATADDLHYPLHPDERLGLAASSDSGVTIQIASARFPGLFCRVLVTPATRDGDGITCTDPRR